jgi:hypothetical protein
MKDDIKRDFGCAPSEVPAKHRQEQPSAPDAASHLEAPPKDRRRPVATFSELLFENSERPPHIMPTGLTIALLAVSMLEGVSPVNLSELLADIRYNLYWADSELRCLAVTTYSIKHWLQLQMARERVAVFELCLSGGSQKGHQLE